MSVIPEKTLIGFLKTCNRLSERALEKIDSPLATTPVPPDLLESYASLIRELHREKRHDTTLADESWEWIWEVKQELNAIQLYGRLAWINYSLIDLL